MTDAAEALPSVDGRRARRDRNRDAVVDAMLALFADGNLSPTLADVATRSGVSHRSVFRYFQDLDELHRVAVERHFAANPPWMEISAPAAVDLPGRVTQFVGHRLDLYERNAAVARVARRRAHQSPVIAERYAESRMRMRDQVADHFRADLDRLPPPERELMIEAVAALCTFEGIETLRVDQGCSAATTRSVLTSSLRRLLSPERSLR